MNKSIVFLIFLLAGLTGCATYIPNLPRESATYETTQVELLEAADCENLVRVSTWENQSLANLTAKCPPKGWEGFFQDPKVKQEVQKISDHLKEEITVGREINPAIGQVFRALYLVNPTQIRAVILGQDPAPTKGQATGLSFSLKPGTDPAKVPSVLRVILEAQNEGFCMKMHDGDLSSWADGGVLLLNMALTIPCPAESTSCEIAGHLALWRGFTTRLIVFLEQQNHPFAYILFGNVAGGFSKMIKNTNHQILKGGHPSPQAPGENFFCKSYFKCTNDWLNKHTALLVSWQTDKSCGAASSCIWTNEHPPKCQATCELVSCP